MNLLIDLKLRGYSIDLYTLSKRLTTIPLKTLIVLRAFIARQIAILFERIFQGLSLVPDFVVLLFGA